jgi:hypothetical protein
MGRKTKTYPADVYIQFVRSLFDNAHAGDGGWFYWILGFMISAAHHVLLFSFVCVIAFLRLRGFLKPGRARRQCRRGTVGRSYILNGGSQVGLAVFISSMCILTLCRMAATHDLGSLARWAGATALQHGRIFS